MEAVKLAPALVPAAVLASKFEAGASGAAFDAPVETASGAAFPIGRRLCACEARRFRAAALVGSRRSPRKRPVTSRARWRCAAAIDASSLQSTRGAGAVHRVTQRRAVDGGLERTEHGDSGRARAWTLRAVRATRSCRTADGYVSDRWRPVSPVTGRLDAFQWQTPVASTTPSDKAGAIEPSPFEKPCWRPRAALSCSSRQKDVTDRPSARRPRHAGAAARRRQDNAPPPAAAEVAPRDGPTEATPASDRSSGHSASASRAKPAETAPADRPLFRSRQDIRRPFQPRFRP
jgi:HemY protein